MKSRVPLLVLAVAVLAAGCQDTPSTAPRPQPRDPNKMIFDGAHHGGNPDFFFLPLIGPDARNSPNFDRGKFNKNLSPVVKICKLVRPITGLTTRSLADVPTSVCGPLVATLSNVTVFPTLEFYLAVWKTRDYNLDPNAFYRVQVFVGNTLLGFVDVTVVTSLREAKNAITGEVVPLAEDWSLPIPFRIETGALTGGVSGACKAAIPDCLEVSVKKAGGTFFTNTRFAGVQLENGWASDAAFAAGGGSILLTIERVTEKDGNCHGGSEGEAAALGRLYVELVGCYHYATQPDLEEFGGFQTSGNKVGQCSAGSRDTDPDADYMLFKSDPGQRIKALRDVPAPVGLICDNFAFYEGLPSDPLLRLASIQLHSAAQAVSRFFVNVAYAWDGGLGGGLELFDAFSNISRGRGLRMASLSPDDQSAPVGEPVELRVRVTREHLHAGDEAREPEAGVEVVFTGGDFGDGVPSITAITDENGEAVALLYLAAGLNTVTATARTIDPTPITFTATGYSPLVSCLPTLEGGDIIQRGFYVPSFPGTTLDRLELYLTSRPNSSEGQPSDAAGIYALTLTARLNTYDGFLVGTSTASATLSGVSGEFVPISFSFPSLPVPQGSRVTFALTYNSRPAGGEALYNTSTTSEGCPIVQTNGTTPPLDSFRRNGIGVLIFGASGGSPVE